MTTYLFPGQGSQAKGMGRDLFKQYPDLIAQADAILGYSSEHLCLEDPEQKLNQTQYTQPLLYIVNVLTFLKKHDEDNTKPTYVAGHSLGEYSALFAAGVFDFATGLKIVKKRGELMSQEVGGSMAAIIGLKKTVLQDLLNQNNLDMVTIANHNSHKQVVISGSSLAIKKAQLLLEEAGAIIFPLSVSGAFHSPSMKTAQTKFAQYLNDFIFCTPTIPVIANTTATPYQQNIIKNTLIEQITRSVQWTESIEYLLNQGETEFEEIGPGNVLTGLVKRIRNGQ